MKKYTWIVAFLFCLTLFARIVPDVQAAQVWSGGTSQPSKLVSVDGVYYYEISTAEELAYIAKAGGEWLGYNYRLANDIVLNDTTLEYDSLGNLKTNASKLNQWTPIRNFVGIFDGNGFTIYGVYVNGGNRVGLFGECSGSIVNLSLKNSYIQGVDEVGGICGWFDGIGMKISKCYFEGAVVGRSRVGGILGGNSCSYIADCGNFGDIFGTGDYVCGVVGSYYAYELERCFNEGNVQSTGNYVAGIAGGSDIYGIGDCINRGNITGNQYVAGICAYQTNATVSRSANTGTITGNKYVGGISGYSVYGHVTSWVSVLTDCYNTAPVNGGSYVGGITGYVEYANLHNCQNLGNVTGKDRVGAIVGHSESIWGKGNVENCHYLQDATVNVGLCGFGNADDADGIVHAQSAEFFCVEGETVHVAGHTYNSGWPCQATCDVCGQPGTGEHSFDQMRSDETGHWYACACGQISPEGVQGHSGGGASCTTMAQCDICHDLYGAYAQHQYTESGISLGPSCHIYACSLCGTWSDEISHEFQEDASGGFTCTACGYHTLTLEHDHLYDDLWYSDTNTHWRVCQICGDGGKLYESGHTDTDNNGVCDVCDKGVAKGTAAVSGTNVAIPFAGGAVVGSGLTFLGTWLYNKKKKNEQKQ